MLTPHGEMRPWRSGGHSAPSRGKPTYAIHSPTPSAELAINIRFDHILSSKKMEENDIAKSKKE